MSTVMEYGLVIPHVVNVDEVRNKVLDSGLANDDKNADWGFNVYTTGGHILWEGGYRSKASADIARDKVINYIKDYWCEMKPIPGFWDFRA